MPRKAFRLPPYCCEYADDKNPEIIRVYFRRPGFPKVRLHGVVRTPSFMAEYEAAKAAYESSLKGPQPASLVGKGKLGTWRWLCIAYMDSDQFKRLGKSTTSTRRRILDSTWEEPISQDSKLTFGDMPIQKMTAKAVRVLRDRKGKTGTAGNERRKVMGYVFAWGVENHEDLVQANPVRDVARVEHKSRPTPPWRQEHFDKFIECYPPGSRERRALALHMFTYARGCDVRNFGPQHCKDGRFAFTQKKTGGAVDVPLLDDLATELALAPKGDLAFLVTQHGATFSEKGYNSWINGTIRKAGIQDRTAHGIRSGMATIAADNGATMHQLMALFGWCSEREAMRYTQAADRKRLATSGSELVKLNRKAI